MPKWILHENHQHLAAMPHPHNTLRLGKGAWPVQQDEQGNAFVEIPVQFEGHLRGLGAKKHEEE